MNDNIDVLNQRIDELKRCKDNAVENGDYPLAAQIRDNLDRVQLKKRRLNPEKLEKVLNLITERNGCYYSYQGGCHQFVGLGSTATEEVRVDGRPKGWCWSCWKSHQMNRLKTALGWCSRSSDFHKGGIASVGWEKMVQPHIGGKIENYPGWGDRIDKSNIVDKNNQKRMRDIMEITNHDAPGIYEPSTIEAINYIACTALGVPTAPTDAWGHNNPKEDSAPQEVSMDEWFSTSDGVEQLIGQALGKLSGTLSHDNVAAAKQILKKILGDSMECRNCTPRRTVREGGCVTCRSKR